ncbi:hypothetical protein [Maricaulis sp.]|uniref:hypothetical protein n=1 Tax=Maricaulis sp. TaxID=1486257 RepID=UPI002627D01D|nr:hypothetical protein [Maricaulis sp.]
MFSLIRLLCFPIARLIGCWPIAVYFALVIPVLVGLYPLSPETMAYVPIWMFPVLYIYLLIGFPLLAYVRKGGWYEVPERSS